MGVDEGVGEKRAFPWMMTASLACLSLCGLFAIRGYPLLGLGIAIGAPFMLHVSSCGRCCAEAESQRDAFNSGRYLAPEAPAKVERNGGMAGVAANYKTAALPLC